MIAGLKPYSAMKDSGIEWLGEVPEHWKIERLKWTVLKHKSGVWGEEPNGNENDIICIRVADFNRQTFRVNVDNLTIRSVDIKKRNDCRLKPGNLLLEKSGGGSMQPVGFVVQYSHDINAISSNFISRVIVRQEHSSDFLTYLHAHLYSSRVNTRSIKQTTGIQNIDAPSYFNEIVTLPPLTEQVAIVQYLDYLNRRGRRLTRVKQKQIALLTEQRQAIIHHAVTRGLDPDAPLKDSGIDWLGKVPEHWEVRLLGRIGRFSKGRGGTKEDEVEIGIPCVRYGDLYTQHRFFVERARSCVSTEASKSYMPIQHGDVLFAGSGETIEEIGKSAVNLLSEPACGSGDVIIFRPSIDVDARFLGLATDCPQATYQKSCMGRGITVMHIYGDELKYLSVLFPPLPEQAAIVTHIEQATANIDTAIASANRETDLLREYQTRLLTDVVTGKIDVREAVAALPKLDPLAAEDALDDTHDAGIDTNLDVDTEDSNELPEVAKA